MKRYIFFTPVDRIAYATFFGAENEVDFPSPESKSSFLVNFFGS